MKKWLLHLTCWEGVTYTKIANYRGLWGPFCVSFHSLTEIIHLPSIYIPLSSFFRPLQPQYPCLIRHQEYCGPQHMVILVLCNRNAPVLKLKREATEPNLPTGWTVWSPLRCFIFISCTMHSSKCTWRVFGYFCLPGKCILIRSFSPFWV